MIMAPSKNMELFFVEDAGCEWRHATGGKRRLSDGIGVATTLRESRIGTIT